jgi:hypothetical protein
METLRSNVSDAVNELNKLLLKTKDSEEKKKIRKVRRIYFALYEEVIKQEIKSNTHEFEEAIDSLQVARDAAVEAKKDINKIAEAINKAVIAAKAVDKIVKIGINLLA